MQPDIDAPLPRFACPDWWEKIKAGETPMAQVPLNEKRAAKALAFFNRLRLPDVAGNPPLSEACGDWFRDILCAFLASEDPETKRRLVWELLCMVPKKNSKTTYVAALGLTALFMEDAPNRQMLLVAPSQNISERCFDQAQGMIRLDSRLRAIFKIQDHLKCIVRRKTGTKLDVKTFDTSIVTGEIPVLTIIDELHELGKKAKAASVMQQIRGGGITMQGGQVLMITTQSDEQPAGIWKTELTKARAIRDGKGGEAPILLPVIYEFPEPLQRDQSFWREQKNWPLILPNLGRSIDPRRLAEDYENNGRATKEAEQIWTSQHLNIEIGVGLSNDRWSGTDLWSGCADPGLTLKTLLDRSEVVTIGIDGGGNDDLLGLAVMGREKVTRRWLLWTHAYANEIVLTRRKDIASRLRDFEEEGSLTLASRGMNNVREMARLCGSILRTGLLPEKKAVGIDPNNASVIFEELDKVGIVDSMRIKLLQGPALQPALYGLDLKLDDKTFSHDGSSMMDWIVSNVRLEMTSKGPMATKRAAGSAKIDPFIAAEQATILMSWNPVRALGYVRGKVAIL